MSCGKWFGWECEVDKVIDEGWSDRVTDGEQTVWGGDQVLKQEAEAKAAAGGSRVH